jgi:5-methylcytosine-specific restriction protein B
MNVATTAVISTGRRAEFDVLFHEFARSYLISDQGTDHLAMYAPIREAGQAAYATLCRDADSGSLDPDLVLLKLLPWTDSEANRKRGAWVHVAPAITGDLKAWFENAGWAKHEDWPEIGTLILKFIRSCVENPPSLEAGCDAFAASPLSKGFQSGFLSPALNSLRPEVFIIGNSKSRTTINHFAGTDLSAHLTDYPALNSAGLAMIDDFSSTMAAVAQSAQPASDLFDAFSHWLVAVKKYDFGAVGYWKIAPGPEGQLWEQWLGSGYAAIGWSELGDLSGMSYVDFETRRAEAIAQSPTFTKEALEQVWNFVHIREGDRLVANQGTTKVLGVGRVTGPYFFVAGDEYGHRLPVEWEDTTPRDVKKGGWRKTLVKLNRADFTEIIEGQGIAAPIEGFNEHTFEFFEGLHEHPTASYYHAHKADFERFVETPLQGLFSRLARRLPPEMLQRLETEKWLFAKILKNDYGKGGAWDFYWGALYTKGAKRTAAPQLFATINRNHLRFGFAIGDHGLRYKTRFAERAAESADRIAQILDAPLKEIGVKFGSAYHDAVDNGDKPPTQLTFSEWLGDPDALGYMAAVSLPRDELLLLNIKDLENRVLGTFEALFPLARLAAEDVPIAEILEVEDQETVEVKVAPPYSLEQFSAETGIDRDTLEMWIRAIDRKGQAILYGPPGTGKTWTAERFAKHLVAGADGLVELVQFHPAYSYEDFIQGIRPSTSNGQLSYELAPGRFVEFCKEVATRSGPSVLIIDEINRANLSRVMGELMYLLEYRTEVHSIPLAGGGTLYIPDQLRVIGTMNTADRSIALVDHALRRRFSFLRLRPNFQALRAFHSGTSFPIEKLIQVVENLNAAIADPDYEIGTSFFMVDALELNIADIWGMEIEPYLEEYFVNDSGKLGPFKWSAVRTQLGL